MAGGRWIRRRSIRLQGPKAKDQAPGCGIAAVEGQTREGVEHLVLTKGVGILSGTPPLGRGWFGRRGGERGWFESAYSFTVAVTEVALLGVRNPGGVLTVSTVCRDVMV